jgi:hypothetical protein
MPTTKEIMDKLDGLFTALQDLAALQQTLAEQVAAQCAKTRAVDPHAQATKHAIPAPATSVPAAKK